MISACRIIVLWMGLSGLVVAMKDQLDPAEIGKTLIAMFWFSVCVEVQSILSRKENRE